MAEQPARFLRITSRPDWIDKHLRGFGARRSNELPCPSRWEVLAEIWREDFVKPFQHWRQHRRTLREIGRQDRAALQHKE